MRVGERHFGLLHESPHQRCVSPLRKACLMGLLCLASHSLTFAVEAKPLARATSLSQNNRFALSVKTHLSKSTLKLRALELQNREVLTDALTKNLWRVEWVGLQQESTAMIERIRADNPGCGVASLRFQRAAVNLKDFDVSMAWHCYGAP